MPIKRQPHRRPAKPKLAIYKHQSTGYIIYKFRDIFYKSNLQPMDFKHNHIQENPLPYTALEIKQQGYRFSYYA